MTMAHSILLIEEHLDAPQALAGLLRRDGHRVTAARTWADAERFCQSDGFDLLLTHARLPTGYKWEQLRRTSACRKAKAIAIADPTPSQSLPAIAAAFDGCLVKPFDPDDLRQSISRVMGSTQ